ncbi:DUF5048 domain-containing protein [Clostridium sp. AF22-10]|uniref:DUF5048 domain-containing protein n=1 Tax=Clostridium sp. AF22-10 TaxID=2293004 RepID=UPI000E5194FB|nr:DUF5048 domain-containing protein [Clostridium sp. AF22-10]
MSYIVTQADLNLLKQGEQNIYIKVELLSSNFKVLDIITGNVIDDTYSVDSESMQRRSYKVTLVVTDSTFQIGKDKKIWLDKRLRVSYGIYSLREKKIIWYKLGNFVYSSVNYSYSASDKTLSLTCPDLMALYDGTLGGELSGYGSSHMGDDTQNITAHGLLIPAGEDMRKSIIATLKAANIENYVVEEMNKEIPYDLEFDTGVTYSQVWEKIRDLYDSWEFFFDIDGTFIWRKIPTCLDDPVVLDNTIMQSIVSESETVDVDFTNVYNVTEVWGKVLELSNSDRYAETSTYADNVYNITLENLEKWSDLDNLTQIGIKICSNNLASPKFVINKKMDSGITPLGDPIPIYDGDQKELTADTLKADTIYVFRYRRLNVIDAETLEAGLFLLGQYQCHGLYKETSKECPFSIPNLGYEVKKSVDYSNLSDDAACFNQAEYLTYTTTAMMDTVNLTTLVIPWLDVNMKIEYKPHNLGKDDPANQYIVKSFSWSVGNGTMSLVLYKFLEDFSFVWKRKYNNTR